MMLYMLFVVVGAALASNAPHPEAYRLEQATESAIDASERLFERTDNLLRDLDSIFDEIPQMDAMMESLTATRAKLVDETAELEGLLRQINVQQLQDLSEYLNHVIDTELSKRDVTRFLKKNPLATEEDVREALKVDWTLYGEHIDDLVRQSITRSIEDLPPDILRTSVTAAPSTHCATPEQVVRLVQESVQEFQHGGPRPNHAAHARIVHSMTSPTYHAPPLEHERLEHVWWRRLVPQDWEDHWLPKGWQAWDARLPSFVAHLLGIHSHVLPAETILERQTLPGSCWPMAGRKGQVTIELPYAVKLDGISLSHTFSSLLMTKEQASSAPRHLVVHSFPPCEDEHCRGALPFDEKQRVFVGEFEYSPYQNRIQTFDVMGDDKDEEDDTSSCTVAESHHCGAQSEIDGVVRAIQLQVIDNWGNDDYTCLYHVQVHGEAAPE